MKANEYFKKHGYRKCKADSLNLVFLNPEFSRELGRLVESHELIESFGGLKKSREYLDEKSVFEWTALDGKLSQAICDVESCQ